MGGMQKTNIIMNETSTFFFQKKTIIIIMVVGNGRCSIALLAYTRVYRFQETLQKSRMCVSQAFWGP